MRRPLIYSLIVHLAVVLLAYFGAPVLRRDQPLVDPAISVDLVTMAEKTNVPQAAKPFPEPEAKPAPPPKPEPAQALAAPEPKPEPKSQPKAEAKPPPPSKVETPAPRPPAEAAPKPTPPAAKAEAKPPEPEPAAVPAPQPKPKTEPKAVTEKAEAKPEKAEPKPPAQPRVAEAKPERKPAPANDFDSVLKTVEEMKRQPPQPAKPASPQTPLANKQTPAKPVDNKTGDGSSLEARLARTLGTPGPTPYDPSRPMTISEIDAIRRQIERCWNLPAGAKDAENLVVEVAVEMNADGTPRTAAIANQTRMRSDPFYRAAAESALRAVLNPRCHPFKLPPDKYDRWRTMTLVFNPKEMFGT